MPREFPSSVSDSIRDELLSKPIHHVEGGRDPETGVDCLWVVGFCAVRFGLPWRDAWEVIKERWEAGDRDPALVTGFTDGWERLPDVRDARPGDVPIFDATCSGTALSGVGFVLHDGLVISCHAGQGVYMLPYDRLLPKVQELWRAVG